MNQPNIITISGLPACGKSTLAKLLVKKLGYQYLYAGSFFRSIAKRKKMSLEKFEILCLKDPRYDIAIDKKMVNYVKTHDQVIYDGHIAAWMAEKNNIPSFKLWIDVPKYIRVKRYAGRENISQNKARQFINHREKFLKKRYQKLYHINYYDKTVYDLIVNGRPLPKEILKNVVKSLKAL